MHSNRRCEKRRDYLLNQIREYELRRVQKARVKKRERLLSAKRREKNGSSGSGSGSTRSIGRPNTPSILTRFQQPDRGAIKRPRTAGPVGDSGGGGNRGRGQQQQQRPQQRPQSSPTRRNISNTLSMPALHAVTSPQRPFYPAQDHAIARIMQHVSGSSSGGGKGGRRRGRNRPSTAIGSSSSSTCLCFFLASVSKQ